MASSTRMQGTSKTFAYWRKIWVRIPIDAPQEYNRQAVISTGTLFQVKESQSNRDIISKNHTLQRLQ